MIELVFNIIFILIAVGAIVGVCFAMKKIAKLKKRFKQAIVLVPLYKTSKFPAIGIGVFSAIIIAALVLMIIIGYYIVCLCIIAMSASVIVLFSSMKMVRCAVLDIGVVVPYKFIDWSNFCDYEIENDTIFFVGDSKGNDTLASATQRLLFEAENKEKLAFILSKYSIRNR
ncbi:MAG: hypothetical protein R3Y23_00855 [Bacillota bacterium]